MDTQSTEQDWRCEEICRHLVGDTIALSGEI